MWHKCMYREREVTFRLHCDTLNFGVLVSVSSNAGYTGMHLQVRLACLYYANDAIHPAPRRERHSYHARPPALRCPSTSPLRQGSSETC